MIIINVTNYTCGYFRTLARTLGEMTSYFLIFIKTLPHLHCKKILMV